MKLLTCIVIFGLVYCASAKRLFFRGRRNGGNLKPPEGSQVKAGNVLELYFNQTLDHANPTNQSFWRQKYQVNDQYFDTEKRNVAFLMIGGEGPAGIKWMTSGTWVKNAEKYKAIMFQLEHRFYGDSHPFNDTSLEHLRFLTSQQAVDDLVKFIVAMNSQYKLASDVKWIVFGGSYSGSLAAWLRAKYPHLVHAASSSSGPLEALVDFQEYLRVVAGDLRDLHSQDCADVVQEGFKQLEASLGDESVDKLFNLCTPLKDNLNDSNSIGNFLEIIADNFAYVAQYNKPTNAHTVEGVCDILTNSSAGTEIQRLAIINNLINGEDSCVDYTWDSLVQELKDESLTGEATSSGMRQWTYQTCTEFGFFQTSTGEPHVFGTKFPIDFFVNLCSDVFDPSYDLDFLNLVTKRTNVIWGSLNIQVSNVIFVHGTVDPWHPLGIYESDNPAAPAILINGTSHCADMYEPTSADSADLENARQQVTKQIGEWLAQ